MRNFPALFAMVILAGCSTTVNLYPDQGPLASQKPLPVLTANVDGITGNTGGITLSLPNGETCTGRWASTAPQYAESVSLLTQYGAVTGIATGIKPGVNRGEAFITCSRGTNIQAEFYTGSGTANGYGVAKDTSGNVYKMIF